MSLELPLKSRKKRSNKLTALLDGGLITYRIGFACQSKDEQGNIVPDPIENCLHSVKIFIQTILNDLDTDKYRLFISGENNFRYEVDPEYKSGRADKPHHYDNIRNYLLQHWNAEIVDNMEEDDAMAIAQTEMYGDIDWSIKEPWNNALSCIVTQDKDLLQVPGWNYNPIKKEKRWITEEEGVRFFYTQMLTGDIVDSIKGVHGIGPKKAQKILQDCGTEKEMLCKVGLMYAAFFEDPEEMMWINGRLLFMLREPDKQWEMPYEFL